MTPCQKETFSVKETASAKSDDGTYLRAWEQNREVKSGWQRQQREQIGPRG